MWAQLAGRVPRLANLMVRLPVLGAIALWLAGVDRRRSVPAFARRPFRRSYAGPSAAAAGGTPVVLWVDSFSDSFDPEVAADVTITVVAS